MKRSRWGWWLAAVVVGVMLVARAQEPAMQQAPDDAAAVDPPSQVARISLVLGNVSIEPASVDQFTAAEQNYPLTTGDRIYADTGANAELETGALALRLGQTTDLTVTAMTDTLAQFGLAQGSVHLKSFALDQGATVELDTPNVAVTVLQPGDVRVDVDAQNDATTVTVISGQVQVDGNGLQQTLQAGQRVRLSGSQPVAAQWLYAAGADGLDGFSFDRDAAYENALASEQQDVNAGTIGAADLAGAGEWSTDAEDGSPIWYPAGVAVGWAPYSCGHWTWIAPWGWTWVGCERWGFAPYHYGRWLRRGERWGWLPGPPVIRPIYAPALVVFVGGPGLAINGIGVTAWFPLGPREPYVPWYHTSPVYLNRVNVSNIYDRNVNRVRMAYNQRSLSPAYAASADRVYVNRQVATVAVAQASFAAGRPVAQAAVRVNAEQLAAAPILPHPLVTPQRTMIAATPARALPRTIARPQLASHEDTGLRAPVNVERSAPAGVERAAPVNVQPAPRNGVRLAPLQTDTVAAPAPVERGPTQAQPTHTVPRAVVEGQPEAARAPAQQPVPAQPARSEPQQPRAEPEQPRALFNKAVPPEPRPSFEQQQKAIESTDPGRPLSAQQMQSLRQNQPVQPQQQREVPHPAPRPAAAPAPRPAVPAVPRKP